MNNQLALFQQLAETKWTDECYTPKWIFDKLQLHFDLDPAAPPHPTHVPCTNHYTINDNGLTQPWHGRIWLNPPFSNPAPWIERFLQHRNGIAMFPFSKSHWFIKIWDDPDTELLYTSNPGQVGIKFHRPDGYAQITHPICTAAIGKENIEALRNLGRTR
jgi:hypothetical protein